MRCPHLFADASKETPCRTHLRLATADLSTIRRLDMDITDTDRLSLRHGHGDDGGEDRLA